MPTKINILSFLLFELIIRNLLCKLKLWELKIKDWYNNIIL